ncbi:MAG TPA: FAD:protein FMN transferase [Gammaproteobacteria bacterium]|nr:FAD:protein FMN transferase [Gammaproteobacteria bacterium]
MSYTRDGIRYRKQWPVSRAMCAIALAFFAAPPAAAEWYHQQHELMGTRITIDLWQDDAALAARCSDRIVAEMQRIEALMSTYRDDSEITRINNEAATKTVEISSEMAHLIERSIHFSKLSGGVFDITYASVGYAYDYREHKQPSDETVAEKLPAIDYRHIELEGNRIHFARPGVRIDLGGIAKGYAVDRSIDIARQCGISRAMISAGGDSRIIGDRGGRPWMIGIRHPRDPAGIALRLPLSDSAISTSGDYERFFIADGKRVHHIIDPHTGRSAGASWSATVIGPDAMTTDALSTTIFIMGADDGLALIENLEGFDAIVIDSGGKVHYSSGFQVPEAAQQ